MCVIDEDCCSVCFWIVDILWAYRSVCPKIILHFLWTSRIIHLSRVTVAMNFLPLVILSLSLNSPCFSSYKFQGNICYSLLQEGRPCCSTRWRSCCSSSCMSSTFHSTHDFNITSLSFLQSIRNGASVIALDITARSTEEDAESCLILNPGLHCKFHSSQV